MYADFRFVVLLLVITVPAGNSYAETQLYGSTRLGLTGVDTTNNHTWSVRDEGSRLGFTSRESLPHTQLAVLAKYEIGVNAATGTFNENTTSNRLAWVGLRGRSWGFYLGAQISPFYALIGNSTDRFNAFGGNLRTVEERLSHLLKFEKHSDNANLLLATVITGHDNTAPDAILLGADFHIGRVTLAAAIEQRAKALGDGVRLGIAATFQGEIVTVAAHFTSTEDSLANFEQTASVGNASDTFVEDPATVAVYLGFNLGDGHTFQLSFEEADHTRLGGENLALYSTPNVFTLGYQTEISTRTRIWAEARRIDHDWNDLPTTLGYSLGLRHDW